MVGKWQIISATPANDSNQFSKYQQVYFMNDGYYYFVTTSMPPLNGSPYAPGGNGGGSSPANLRVSADPRYQGVTDASESEVQFYWTDYDSLTIRKVHLKKVENIPATVTITGIEKTSSQSVVKLSGTNINYLTTNDVYASNLCGSPEFSFWRDEAYLMSLCSGDINAEGHYITFKRADWTAAVSFKVVNGIWSKQ
jgi:hypothetical protein